MGQESFISVIGTHYLQAVVRLLEFLMPVSNGEPDRVNVPFPENAYSASICILSAIFFESCVMKLRFEHPQGNQHQNPRNAIEYFGLLHPDYPELEHLRDIFVLRDCLVHNHIWQIDVAWDERLKLKVEDACMADFSGDKKFAVRVDNEARRTRVLGLHVVPIEVDQTDAIKVIRKIWSAMEFIDSKHPNAIAAGLMPLQYGKEKVRFPDVVRRLPNA